MEWRPEAQFPKEFHEVALAIYRDDPKWIPEEWEYLRAAFGPSNPYFGRSSAWIDADPGRARIAGFFNPDMIIDGKNVAFFGYWETIDDLALNEKLFADFEAWARKKGAKIVYGPINFSTFGANRIRLNAFDAGCYLGEPYNPHYYQNIVESLGYKCVRKYVSMVGNLKAVADNFYARMPSVRDYEKKFHVRFIKLTPQYWLEHIKQLYEYCDIIFLDNFAYSKISFEQYQQFFGPAFVSKFCPETSVLVLNEKEQIAGFLISFPDYSPLCSQGGNPYIPSSQLQYDKHFRLINDPMFISKSGGVHPDYRQAQLYAMINYVASHWALEAGYTLGAASTIRKDNPALKLLRQVATHPDDVEHVYGLFSKTID